MTRKTWSSEIQKKMHHARIGTDIKESIHTLSIINGKTKESTTEELLRVGLRNYENQIRDYHAKRSKGF